MKSKLLLSIVLYSASLPAEGTYLYTNNDTLGRNSVSAFSVAVNGALTQTAGSPFATNGAGNGGNGSVASNRITSARTKRILYAANAASNNVSAFSINPISGALSAVAGSPFATGGTGGPGISLAVTPDESFLIAANSGSRDITVFGIAANGALTPVAGSPFPAGPGGEPVGIKVTPNGKFLAVANLTETKVSMFGISATGGLSQVAGSPFPAGGDGHASSVECNCASTHLYAAKASFGPTIVSAQDISPNGALSPIAGSPFVGPGTNSVVSVLSADDTKLFVSNDLSNTVTVFTVAPNGGLTLVPGSPFATPGSAFPAGMATNEAGTFLYVAAAFNNTVGAFSVAPSGALTPIAGQPFSTGLPGIGLLSLTVFPGKECCPAPVVHRASASPDKLRPANHKMVEVAINYTVSDPCPNTCGLTISSNEPVNGIADGKSSPDWRVIGPHHVALRAERAGSGSGRTYTITITCTNDTNQKSSVKTVTVLVPHDQGR